MSWLHKKYYLSVLLILLGLLSVETAYPQENFVMTIQNQSVHFGATIDTLFFDIYMQKTGLGNIYLANCDFRINFNSTFFTSPAMAISATPALTGYGMAAGIPATGVLSASLSPPTPADNTDFGPVIPPVSTVAPGSRLATVRVRGVTNRAGTAGLTFRNGQAQYNCLVTDFDTTDVSATTTVTITANGTYTNPTDLPLPVELASLAAVARGRSIELSWSTKTETNNYGFDIERKSADTWTKVGFIEGKGTTNAPQSYSYKDAVKAAGTYAYRLKQTDRDGKFTYSAQVEAKATLSPEDYKMSQNYPNPFNPTTKFNFAVKTPQHVAVKVFNSLGQEVRTLFNEVANADELYEVSFDGTGLASGIYFYVLRAQDRFEVKKMLMVK